MPTLLESAGDGAAAPQTLAARSALAARRALAHFDFSSSASVTVVGVAGDVTLRIDDPARGERAAMRLHRPGRHTVAQLKSELLWLDALRADRCVPVPVPFAGRRGERVITIDVPGGGPRHVTVCSWLDGRAPDPDGDAERRFALLGGVAARLHGHALRWTLPPGFVRRPCGTGELLGPAPGDARRGPDAGIGAAEAALLARAEQHVRADLAAYARVPGARGLVHGDLRASKLLLDEAAGEVRVFGFGGCGAGWLMHDFGVAAGAVEEPGRLDRLAAAWCAGYRARRPLPAALEAQLPAFVMLQRLARLRRGGGGAGAAGRVAGTCEVAERYLGGRLI